MSHSKQAKRANLPKEVGVTVRFPKDVLAAAKKAARDNDRSQNAQIVHLVASGLGLREQPKVAS